MHPLRTRLYRQYTPNEFSQEPGMPHIMQVNQQHAANKRKFCAINLTFFEFLITLCF